MAERQQSSSANANSTFHIRSSAYAYEKSDFRLQRTLIYVTKAEGRNLNT